MLKGLEIRWDDAAPSPWGDVLVDDKRVGYVDREDSTWLIVLQEPRLTMTIESAGQIAEAELLTMIGVAAA